MAYYISEGVRAISVAGYKLVGSPYLSEGVGDILGITGVQETRTSDEIILQIKDGVNKLGEE